MMSGQSIIRMPTARLDCAAALLLIGEYHCRSIHLKYPEQATLTCRNPTTPMNIVRHNKQQADVD